MNHLIEDMLILLEHPPVITLGKRGKYSNILVSKEYLNQNGIQIFEINRGGDVTYHGPGQLVGYFIVNLANYNRSIKNFITGIEDVFINLLMEQYSIKAYRGFKEHTGVWVDDKKITAIGVAVSRMITMHGFAFNINTDLEHFNWINPCGITDKGVTSLKQLTGVEHDLKEIALLTAEYYCKRFGIKSSIIEKDEIFKYLEYEI
jgi:lipoyl(octanoyl) transferase